MQELVRVGCTFTDTRMWLRLGWIIVVLGTIGLAVRATKAQDPLVTIFPYFTIVSIPDIHIENDSGVAADPHSWDSINTWIPAHAGVAPWNVVGGIGLGDINAVTSTAQTNIETRFTGFWNAGVPFVLPPGNHDTLIPNQTAWDNSIGAYVRTWLSLYPTNMVFANDEAQSTYTPHAVTQYARVDVPTTAGTVKMALTASMMRPSAAAINQIKTQALVDSDRHVLFGIHMFLAATYTAQSLPNTTDTICSFANTGGLCAGVNGVGAIDETGVWNILKGIPNLTAIYNGHTHGETNNDGVHSLRMNNTAGNPVQMLSGHMITAQTKAGIIMLSKFRTDNHTVEFYEWITCNNWPTCTTEAADTGVWGAPLIMPWTPIISGGTGVVHRSISGRMDGGRVQ